MSPRRRKPRDKGDQDLANRYRDGEFDSDRLDENEDATGQTFSSRNKNAQQEKILKTTQMRADHQAEMIDPETLPLGQITQVYSRYCEIEFGDQIYLCVVRKTLTKISETQLVVGDRVRFRITDKKDESGRPEAVIEHVQPRKTVLTRADSFKGTSQHPIVANAEQMLIVASAKLPGVKWGLVDRMIIAARSGGLSPIVCLNKTDLLDAQIAADPEAEVDDDETVHPLDALSHYTSLGIQTLRTSVIREEGLNELMNVLKDHTTVLAGHSGVGKSSLIRAIQPSLDIRIGDISHYTAKGRHTTTSARRYLLDFGGTVVDTPGVKLFGLWGVSRENLEEFFPDVENQTAPPWRVASFKRISASLAE